MKSIDLNTRIIDSYTELLKNLSITAKLDLISKLSQSLKKNFKNNNTSFERSFGAWDSEVDAEKLVKSIRSTRYSNRRITEL